MHVLCDNLLHCNPINLLDFIRPAFSYICNDRFGQCNSLPEEFLWKFSHSFNCTIRVVPILQATLHPMVKSFLKQRGHYHHQPVSIWRVLVLVQGGRMHFIPLAIALTPYFHLIRFVASSISNPILFTLSSTCLLHVCFGLPHFRCPFTASINAFFTTLSYFLLTTCPYHLTPFTFAILSTVFFKPSISIHFPLSDYAFYPLISLHTLISQWLFSFFLESFFLRLPSRFPSNIICILFGNDEGNHQHDSSDPILDFAPISNSDSLEKGCRHNQEQVENPWSKAVGLTAPNLM